MSAIEIGQSPNTIKRSRAIQASIRSYALVGLFVAITLFGGALLWSVFASLEGAVVSQGMVVVQSNLRKIQHPTGGIIGEIAVKEGQSVREGDVLLRLDETITRANLQIISDQLEQLYGRKARLEAERDGTEAILFAPELLKSATALSVTQGETALFDARRASRVGQEKQLAERILQLREEIIGLSEQVGSKAREIDLIRQELVGVNELYQKNLIPLSRLTALQREETRLTGERGQIIAQIASARGKISETELQILNIAKDMQTEVTRDLREVEAKTAELRERRVAAEDQLRRIVLHSPVSGVVHQLSVHTLGGVIQAGEQLMLIVPQDDTLSVEARVSPVDIDPIKIGGLAHLKFVAFDQRKTPELSGRIAMISADIVQQQTQSQQMPFYNVRIELPKSEVDKLGGQRIVPGMPVEVFIATTERSAFSYFMKPLSDQFARTFKDK